VVLHVVDRGGAVVGPQSTRPALVLAQGADERRVPRLVECDVVARAVVTRSDGRRSRTAGPPARLLHEVALLAADLDPVERRLGDVDVARVDQPLHVTEQERQDQRADVGAVDVGVVMTTSLW
jgi:hypothetical protein